MTNTGLNLELETQHRNPEDWEHKLQGTTWCIAMIPADVREHYLPRGERQDIGEEKFDCTSRAALNVLETKFNFLLRNNLLPETHYNFLDDHGFITKDGVEFSDRYISIKAGTSREGNSLIKPIDTIHRHGVIPKYLYPQVESYEEYYDPLRCTHDFDVIGRDFLKLFSINYVRVYAGNYFNLREKELLIVGGHAWPEPKNGVYERTEEDLNHAYVNVKNNIVAFDNYTDPVDGDFLKNLAPDYRQTPYGYRLVITIKDPTEKSFWSFFRELLETFSHLIPPY